LRLRTLFLLLIAASGLAQENSVPAPRRVRLTCSWADRPTGEITAQTSLAGGQVRLNGLERAIDFPTVLVRGEEVELFLQDQAGDKPRSFGKLSLPMKGDDFAVILGTRKDRPIKAWLLAAGLADFPKGATYLINRSEQKLRVTLQETTTEIAAEGFALLGFVPPTRTVASLRIEALTGKKWDVVTSNRFIISPDQRMVLLVGPSEEDASPFQLRGVIDPNSGSYQKATPLTAEPPLPGPPAK
jgi:hypothetical protein